MTDVHAATALPAQLESLRGRLGPAGFVDGANVSDRYAKDWSGVAAHRPALVLRPATTEQLADALRTCHALGQPVVVQGGLTGLCGGATPCAGEVSISTERMARIEQIDPVGMTATVQAGVTLGALQRAAAEAGLLFPLDFGSRGSCTLGGNLACNAGGNNVIRYGVARELALGLEVVLADGTVLSHLNRMAKNSTGYDLKHLFIGTEGTLGVIARAVVRLHPAHADRQVAFVACDSVERVLELLQEARSALGTQLTAFEVMWDSYLSAVRGQLPKLRVPIAPGAAVGVLIEASGSAGEALRLDAFLERALEAGRVSDAALASSGTQAREFWAIRDAVAELIGLYRHVLTFDVSLPIVHIPRYEAEVSRALRARRPDLTMLCFGHLGDGTLHLTIDLPEGEDEDALLRIVLEPLAAYGGVISAEHGIGRVKREFLSMSRTVEEIAAMRNLKSLLDPRRILNRGRVFDADAVA